jgi:hypothetical protein
LGAFFSVRVADREGPDEHQRLFSAEVNPELKTVAAIADALDAEVCCGDAQSAGVTGVRE